MREFIALFYQEAIEKIQTELIAQEFHDAIFRMEELLETIKRDPQQIAYRKESINQTLQKEFAGQIQPIKGQSGPSSIMLSENDKIYFHITVENNCIENNTENQFKPVQYKKVYLIDDPFILDNLERDRRLNQLFFNSEESLLNSGHILSHNDKLRLTLTESKQQSIFEQTVLNDKLKNIREKIDQILPGTFELSSEGRYYVQNGVKLQISNLATGSKMFSIIKILLDKGELGDSTMLILDEPEAHLHPMWQNAFAEIIVLLVKELKLNVLLTTHSPNFVLALDAYMRKYRLEEKSNFYQTQILEDGFVQYNCMDDDIGKIYEDFLQYLSEVKMLRSFYMRHGEEIEADEGMDEVGYISMVKQDVENYVTANWGQHQETVTELSKEQKKGTSLVLSDTQMYNFDQITKEIYATRKNGIPTSADALTFSKKHILLVEFKSGFKKKSS